MRWGLFQGLTVGIVCGAVGAVGTETVVDVVVAGEEVVVWVLVVDSALVEETVDPGSSEV